MLKESSDVIKAKGKRLSLDEELEIVALREQGLNYFAIHKKTGKHQTTIKRVLEEYKIVDADIKDLKGKVNKAVKEAKVNNYILKHKEVLEGSIESLANIQEFYKEEADLLIKSYPKKKQEYEIELDNLLSCIDTLDPKDLKAAKAKLSIFKSELGNTLGCILELGKNQKDIMLASISTLEKLSNINENFITKGTKEDDVPQNTFSDYSEKALDHIANMKVKDVKILDATPKS